MTEEFWQREQLRKSQTPDEQNKILKQTYKDAASIKTDKHPKALYIECLKDSPNWHTYAASSRFSVEDMSMLVCKDLGCAVNYCGLLKKSVPMEWEGTDDCQQEFKSFNDCMV